MERSSKSPKKSPSTNLKKPLPKKPKKAAAPVKTIKKPKTASPRKVASGKTLNQKVDRVTPPTRAESQHRYFEILGSRIADRAYELYVQRGSEHGHDIEDWLAAERQILPKEIFERS
jgi:hypothetical protein